MSDFKVALITGASSGIGEALALDLARRGGWKIGLFSRRSDRLQEVRKKILALRSEAEALVGDVHSPDDLKTSVELIEKRWGRIDLVIANAGFGVRGRFQDLSESDYRRQFETNIYGVIHTVKATTEALKKTEGMLALMGSVVSYVSLPGSSAYSMSKAAVRSLAEALYHEYSDYKISVTLICPGVVDSEFQYVDNAGRFDPAARIEPAPFKMDRFRAARLINSAIIKRRREIIITGHGRLGILLKRYCPSFFHLIVSYFKIEFGMRRKLALFSRPK